jgi:hypothetical protein
MRVRIFHTDDLSSAYFSDGPGTGLREVFAYDEPGPAPGRPDSDPADHLAILEQVFMLFNVGDDPAFGTPDPRAVAYRGQRLRSLSVGDVVALDDAFYACASLGWQHLDTAPDTIETTEQTGTDPTAPNQ